jgi:hypothetical protein
MAVEALVGPLGSREYPARQTEKENINESNLVVQDLSSTLEIAVHGSGGLQFFLVGICLCRLVEFEECLAAHAFRHSKFRTTRDSSSRLAIAVHILTKFVYLCTLIDAAGKAAFLFTGADIS